MRPLLITLSLAFSTVAFAQDDDADGYTIAQGDCDDTDATINPGAVDICDGIDQDCDGVIDDVMGGSGLIYYEDADQDGYGTGVGEPWLCSPAGMTPVQGDCDDANPAIYPGAPEFCDGIDTDCDGTLDPVCDDDLDGDGYTVDQGDCNDNDDQIHPGAVDVCDGIDQDCDGVVDDVMGGSAETYYPDLDQDGYGAGAGVVWLCQPADSSPVAGDCDDADDQINPGALDVCDDGIDQDCNGIDETCDPEDLDGDGFTVGQGDCDDTNASINPAALEICDDGIDQNCNGVIDEGCVDDDFDGDGFSIDDGDCDDTDASIHPGALEICDDGIDQDCDGVDDTCPGVDADGDGFDEGVDCDDTDPSTFPGAPEVCEDEIDQDCDGTDEPCDDNPGCSSSGTGGSFAWLLLPLPFLWRRRSS